MQKSLAIFAIAAGTALLFTVLRAQDVTQSVWDGVYTREQAERGLAEYNVHCLDCHGEDLEGDAETPPLRGGQFLTNWDGQSVGALYIRIRRDMPLNFEAGKLSPAVNAALVAYILSINKYPPGPVELPHNVEVLNQIRFEIDHGKRKRERGAAAATSGVSNRRFPALNSQPASASRSGAALKTI